MLLVCHYLCTHCLKRSCCGFYPCSLRPVWTGTAPSLPLARADPGHSRAVPDQRGAYSPLRYPGSGRMNPCSGAGLTGPTVRGGEETLAREQPLSTGKEARSSRCCRGRTAGWVPEGTGNPRQSVPGRGADWPAGGRAESRCRTWRSWSGKSPLSKLMDRPGSSWQCPSL